MEGDRRDAPGRPTARPRAALARRRGGRPPRSGPRSRSRSRRGTRAGGRTFARRAPACASRRRWSGTRPRPPSGRSRPARAIRAHRPPAPARPRCTRMSGRSALMAVGDATRQPAAADRHERPAPIVGQVLDDLEADRALTGDDPVVVEGRDDRETTFGGERLGPRLAAHPRRGRRRRSRHRRPRPGRRLIAGASSGMTTTAVRPEQPRGTGDALARGCPTSR